MSRRNQAQPAQGQKKHKGVKFRGDGIQIDFVYRGKRHRKILDLPQTEVGLSDAARLRHQICEEIRSGKFQFEYHFPDTSKATPRKADVRFETYVELHLQTADLSNSTKTSYIRYANKHILPVLGQRKISEITASDLLKWRTGLADPPSGVNPISSKTINNTMIVVRQALELALGDKIIEANPAVMLRNLKLRRSASVAQPFNLIEIAKIRAAADEPWQVNLVDCWWGSGLRTGELIALMWDRIDEFNERIRVESSHVGGEVLVPKDQEHRTATMTSIVSESLERQRPITGRHPSGYVFVDPRTGEPFRDSKELGEFLKPILVRALGAAYRRQYNLRHSYASFALSAGEPMIAVRDQLGHESFEMLEKHYGHSMLDSNRRRWNGFEDVVAEAKKVFAKHPTVIG